MTPPPWPFAVPPAGTPRHARPARAGGAGPRRAPGPRSDRPRRRDASTWFAAALVAVAVAGGVGTASLVQPAGAGTASDDVASDGLAPAGPASDGLAPAGLASGGLGPAGSGSSAGELSATRGAAPSGVRVTVPAGTRGDFRPLPVIEVVDRDTVGTRWLTPADRAAGLLSLDVPESATGVLDVVPGSSPAPGAGGTRSVRVEVERGLPVDGAAFAATVMSTLNDPRGWGAHGEVTFARTDGPADLRVVLASPRLVDALCAPLDTGGQVSCGRNGHAALNFRRWVLATPEFADLEQYRQYLVNHEVGHLLGHRHEQCPGAGQPAPLMQQQSLAVAPCEPNGWPYPQG